MSHCVVKFRGVGRWGTILAYASPEGREPEAAGLAALREMPMLGALGPGYCALGLKADEKSLCLRVRTSSSLTRSCSDA